MKTVLLIHLSTRFQFMLPDDLFKTQQLSGPHVPSKFNGCCCRLFGRAPQQNNLLHDLKQFIKKHKLDLLQHMQAPGGSCLIM